MRKVDRWLEHPEMAGSEPGQSLVEVIKAYLADCVSRSLSAGTIESYTKVFDHLKAFAANRGIVTVDALDVTAISEYRQSRRIKASTQAKELQALRAFCAWCHARRILPDNPAQRVKMPQRDSIPTMPYTHDEIVLMWNACEGFADGGGKVEHRRRSELRARALLLLLLYSGLRISDASLLRRDRINLHTRKLLLRMEKTRVPVYLTLHPSAVAALAALPAKGDYFFWSGRGREITHVKNSRRTIKRIIERAGLSGHPHRFRDTFAVELLLAGESLETVQRLLGHTSIRTAEKHYAPYVAAFQTRLDSATAKLDFLPASLRVEPAEHALGNAQRRIIPLTATR
jgi:site-specific recombinase XerD